MNFETIKVEIPANKSKSYPILIGTNLLLNIGDLIKESIKAEKILIVTNKTIFDIYGNQLKDALEFANYFIDFVILEDGEQYKKIHSLEKIWEKAIDFNLERKDAILAFGGGVIGDVTGFAASTYLRGVDFIQVPTTLLAQVDSSVGGKVAINCNKGKNLIGAFHQPKIVIADINTLKTLPLEQLKTGLGEVLKYGFIEKTCGSNTHLETSLIDFLKENKDKIFSLNPEIMQKLIKYCCQLKASVVNQDEREAGLRAILNFGHTIGHAIEKCTNYEKFTHGQAVAMGMVGVFDIAKNKNLISNEYLFSSLELIGQYDLNYHIPKDVSLNDVQNSLILDKKVIGKKIRFVLPVNNGEVRIFSDIEEEIVRAAIKKLY